MSKVSGQDRSPGAAEGGHRRIGSLRRHGRRLVAMAIIAVAYGAARLPEVSAEQRSAAAARFRFDRLPLPELPGGTARGVRAVHPRFEHISAWISSVGAGVALADFDGDGLANDLCHVDPRTDAVVVAPVPGTPERYRPSSLSPGQLRYDPSTMAPMGCIPGDVNEDGLTDLIVYYWGRTPIAFLKRADAYVPTEIVSGEERWFTNAATLADLDGDGHLDLVFANYFQDGARILDARADGRESMQYSMSRAYNAGGTYMFLWKGASAGAEPSVRFEAVPGVLEEHVAHAWTLALGACDLDGDLLPELYFANDFGPDRLLHNRSTPGQLRFARVEGEGTISTPSSKVLGRDSFKGMGVDFGDLNGDAIPDIVVSNIAAEYALLESHFAFVSTGDPGAMQRGVAPYVDRSEPLGLSRSGWGWDLKLADLDNDGALELLQATGFVRGTVNRWPELQELATANDGLLADVRTWPRFRPGDDLSGHEPNAFFARAGDRFANVAREVGLDQPQVSRGIAVADVDGDGDLDFAVANQWEPSFFHRNHCADGPADDPGATRSAGRCGEFLGFNLLLPLRAGQLAATEVRPGHPGGAPRGRPAVGAQATVHLPDGRRLIRHVDGGGGHSGKRSQDVHFGLGGVPRDQPLRVDLRYRGPGGRIQEESLRLTPGWHTILLASPGEGGK